MADKVMRPERHVADYQYDPDYYVCDEVDALHASIIEQGRKVLNATSDKGMSHADFIEWVMGELEGK